LISATQISNFQRPRMSVLFQKDAKKLRLCFLVLLQSNGAASHRRYFLEVKNARSNGARSAAQKKTVRCYGAENRGFKFANYLSLSYHNHWPCKGHISQEGGHVGKVNLALCRYANPVLSCWSLLIAGSRLGSSTSHERREDQLLHECNGLRMAIIADSVYSCEAVSGWLIC
jgi:hypothetical protein